MPTFPSLPNEILGRIIRTIHPADLDSLALVNKHIYAVARKTLKRHLMLKKKYSILNFAYRDVEEILAIDDAPGGPPDDARTALLFLDRIIQEPDIAYYPRTLYLESLCVANYRIPKKLSSIPATYSTTLEKLLDGCFYTFMKGQPDDTPPDTFDRKLTLHILVTALVNLETIFQCETYDYPSELLHEVIRDIADANRDEKSPFHGKALTKLRQYYVLSQDLNVYVDMNAFGFFAMLPSMRVLGGSCIACDEFSWPPGFHLGPCSVTDLDITNSSVSPNALKELIFGIPALKRFKYHHSGTEVGDAIYEPNAYVEALRARATARLESLDIWVVHPELLSEDETDQQYVGSLKAFSVLEHIRLETVAFERVEMEDDADDEALDAGKFYQDQNSRHLEGVAVQDSGGQENIDDKSSHSGESQDEEDVTALGTLMDPLIDVVPPSVKSLTLIQRSNDEDMRHLLRGLVRHQAERLPNLSKITFECLEPVDADIKSVLTGAGIEVEETEGLLDRRERRVLAGRIVYDD